MRACVRSVVCWCAVCVRVRVCVSVTSIYLLFLILHLQSPPKGATIPYRPKPSLPPVLIAAGGHTYAVTQGQYTLPTAPDVSIISHKTHTRWRAIHRCWSPSTRWPPSKPLLFSCSLMCPQPPLLFLSAITPTQSYNCPQVTQ